MARSRIGVWLIGARGGVATTVIVGLVALKKGLAGSQGLVSTLPQFADLDLCDWKDLVVGGHDIRNVTLFDEAMQLNNQSHVIGADLIQKCKSDLDKIDRNIRPGTLVNVGSTIESFASDDLKKKRETPRDAIARIQADLTAFVKENKLDRLIVMNVASTEPPVDPAQIPAKWSELEKLLAKPQKCPLAASSIYAVAALELGHAYVNFTPSLGSAPAALDELAKDRGACHMGHDGKTGETLLKSVLAPMFAARNLEVMSWVGHNIFGNMDGKVLNDPSNKKTKVTSKDKLLSQIFGYAPQTHVSIEYIESLGDWKTAWDHIHFKGFLNTPMILTFTWQGCDSLLAAPLVLDLVRFTDRAARAGHTGLMPHLACFFKSPLGTPEHNFVKQFQMLEEWTASVVGKG